MSRVYYSSQPYPAQQVVYQPSYPAQQVMYSAAPGYPAQQVTYPTTAQYRPKTTVAPAYQQSVQQNTVVVPTQQPTKHVYLQRPDIQVTEVAPHITYHHAPPVHIVDDPTDTVVIESVVPQVSHVRASPPLGYTVAAPVVAPYSYSVQRMPPAPAYSINTVRL